MLHWRGMAWNGRKCRSGVARAIFGVALAGVFLSALRPAESQDLDAPAPQTEPPPKPRTLVSHFPEAPSTPPKWVIPIDPLGFTAPGPIYLGSRNTLVSLDFIDEDRLLLTFRIPGLLHRDTVADQDSDERQIRAVVLRLPQGTVEAQTTWKVHDRLRYLWMLHNGHFLVRDRNNLFEGDASLKLKPYLDFPGSLLWLELDPDQQYLVTNSVEPVAAAETPGHAVGSPATAAANVTSDGDSAAGKNDSAGFVVRILSRSSGQVMLVSRTRVAVHLPINSQGYLENLRSQGSRWMLNLRYFTGGSKLLGGVESACEPEDDFLSEKEILVTACDPDGGSKLVAMTTAGRTLWVTEAPGTEIWPHLKVAANGLRLAWATLDATHTINSYAPMSADEIKEQSVTVFDAADGNIPLVAPLSPIFDAGGNVALSSSGRRIALINGGVIQVFESPAPPAVPVSDEKHPRD